MNRYTMVIGLAATSLLLSAALLVAQESQAVRFVDTIDDLRFSKDSKFVVCPVFYDEGKAALDAVLKPEYREPAFTIIKHYLNYFVTEEMLEHSHSIPYYDNSIFEQSKLVIKYAADGLIGVEVFHPYIGDKDRAARAGLFVIKHGAVVGINLAVEYMRDCPEGSTYTGAGLKFQLLCFR